jgi:hypothetical protein
MLPDRPGLNDTTLSPRLPSFSMSPPILNSAVVGMDSIESDIFIIDLLSAERPWQTGKAIGTHCSERFIPGTGTLLPHPFDTLVEESS